jgi:hypothetical protein
MARQGGLAEDLRAGLSAPPSLTVVKRVAEPLDEVWHRKTVRVHVRDFGALLGFILVAVAAYGVWRRWEVLVTGALIVGGVGLYTLGARKPGALVGFWRRWMKGAEAIGLVMTTIILGFGWFMVVVPTSLVLRVLRVRVMDTTFREPVGSYWEARDSKLDDFKLLERQF